MAGYTLPGYSAYPPYLCTVVAIWLMSMKRLCRWPYHLTNLSIQKLLQSAPFMPSRLGHGLYEKLVTMKIIFFIIQQGSVCSALGAWPRPGAAPGEPCRIAV